MPTTNERNIEALQEIILGNLALLRVGVIGSTTCTYRIVNKYSDVAKCAADECEAYVGGKCITYSDFGTCFPTADEADGRALMQWQTNIMLRELFGRTIPKALRTSLQCGVLISCFFSSEKDVEEFVSVMDALSSTFDVMNT